MRDGSRRRVLMLGFVAGLVVRKGFCSGANVVGYRRSTVNSEELDRQRARRNKLMAGAREQKQRGWAVCSGTGSAS